MKAAINRGFDTAMLEIDIVRADGPHGVVLDETRARSAMQSIGLTWPEGMIARIGKISSASADGSVMEIVEHSKRSAMDLAIAMSAAEHLGYISARSQMVCRGALGLDGRVLDVSGTSWAIHGLTDSRVLVSSEFTGPMTEGAGSKVSMARTLDDAITWARSGREPVAPPVFEHDGPLVLQRIPNMETIHRQMDFHPFFMMGTALGLSTYENVMLVAPPGSGRTVFARRAASLIPDAQVDVMEKTMIIYDMAGITSALFHGKNTVRLPYRAPHHTITHQSLAGDGGIRRHMTEFELANGGVLFLDEAQLFSGLSMNVLRRRLDNALAYGNRFGSPEIVIGAVSDCECEYGAMTPDCECSLEQHARWRQRIERMSDVFGLFAMSGTVETLADGIVDTLPQWLWECAESISDRIEVARLGTAKITRGTRSLINSLGGLSAISESSMSNMDRRVKALAGLDRRGVVNENDVVNAIYLSFPLRWAWWIS